jgi:hypothetical protein
MVRFGRLFLIALLLLPIVTLTVASAASDTSGMDIYRLQIRLTTTSDWTRLAIDGATIAPFVDQVVEGAGAPQLQVTAGTDLAIAKKQFDETRVIAIFEVYLTNLDPILFTVSITKGALRSTTAEVFYHNQEPPQLIATFIHEGVSGDPENKRIFSLDVAQLTARGGVTLPPKPVVDKKVLAFYYPWYGTPTGPTGQWRHWDPSKPHYTAAHTPLAGYYDSLDEATITRHIQEAQEAGLDAFISSWWGIDSFEDRAFQKILPIAEHLRFLATIYYEIADNRDQIAQDLSYILTRYGGGPAFLKVNGVPVIFIYGRVTSKFQGSDWAFVFQQLAQQNLHCFCLGDDFYDYLYEQFQGVHTYNPVSMPLDQIRKLYAVNALRARIKQVVFAATVVPGYDDTFVRAPGFVQDRQNGEYYRQSWAAALASNPDWVLVTSFNEWHEGSEIEPSVEFGRQYLDLTRQEADSWKGK